MINQVVKGAMTYLKRPFILKFDENEPKVYKLQVVRGNVIKEEWQRMPCSTPSITSVRMVAV